MNQIFTQAFHALLPRRIKQIFSKNQFDRFFLLFFEAIAHKEAENRSKISFFNHSSSASKPKINLCNIFIHSSFGRSFLSSQKQNFCTDEKNNKCFCKNFADDQRVRAQVEILNVLGGGTVCVIHIFFCFFLLDTDIRSCMFSMETNFNKKGNQYNHCTLRKNII